MTLEEKRLALHSVLTGICDHVYFQPPESIKIVYPAIIYKRDGLMDIFSDDDIYHRRDEFLVTVVDTDPDSSVVEAVSKLRFCSFQSSFVSENLNHTNFQIYY